MSWNNCCEQVRGKVSVRDYKVFYEVSSRQLLNMIIFLSAKGKQTASEIIPSRLKCHTLCCGEDRFITSVWDVEAKTCINSFKIESSSGNQVNQHWLFILKVSGDYTVCSFRLLVSIFFFICSSYGMKKKQKKHTHNMTGKHANEQWILHKCRPQCVKTVVWQKHQLKITNQDKH